MVPVERRCHTGSFAAGLRDRHARFKPCYYTDTETGASAAEFILCKRKRRPYISRLREWSSLKRKCEGGRHDADDGVRLPVDFNGLAQDIGICVISSAPQRI